MAAARTWWLRLATVGVVVLAFEASSAAALWLLARKGLRYEPVLVELLDRHRALIEQLKGGAPGYLEFDKTLGWRPRALGAAGLFRANAAGLRADREYADAPADRVLRVAAFGDSYVHGDEVTFADTWEQKLEDVRPDLEVINLGVPGYGLDQAYLRYQALGRRGAQFVVIGFMTEDFSRAVNTFRPFHFGNTSVPFAKPRFVLDGDALRLLPNPYQTVDDYERLLADPARELDRLGAHDFEYAMQPHAGPFDFLATVRAAKLARSRWLEPQGHEALLDAEGFFNTKSEAFRINLALIEAFASAVTADGAQVLVVLFPGRNDIAFAREHAGRGPSEPLSAALSARGIPVHNLLGPLLDAARTERLTSLYLRSHYSPRGNRVVAEALASRLPFLVSDPVQR